MWLSSSVGILYLSQSLLSERLRETEEMKEEKEEGGKKLEK